MAVTRLMDMRLEDEEQVAAEVKRFLAEAEQRDG
jgi:pyruvate,water dikinase